MCCFPAERATAEIDTAALLHNYALLVRFSRYYARGKLPRTIAVVKANAYGHGTEAVVSALLLGGCDFFAVATLNEAITVRKHAPLADILILGYTPPQHAATLAEHNITQTVFSREYAAELSKNATVSGCIVKIHLKIDGGMCRLGFAAEDTESIFCAARLPHLCPCGIYTHFPVADTDLPATRAAFSRFLACRLALSAKGLSLFAHAAASATLLSLPEAVLDGARVGLALYGIAPVKTTLSLSPALTLTAPIIQLHHVAAGTPVGYGGSFVAKQPSLIGTLPIGYGDGLSRSFGKRVGYVSYRGRAVPVAGNICMDQMMVDLTNTAPRIGDRVVIFSDPCRVAAALDTIPYEILTSIGARVQRKKKN